MRIECTYYADDGTEFDTEEECLAYENTIKQIGSAARFFNDKLTREMTTVEEISQYGIFAYILDEKKAEAVFQRIYDLTGSDIPGCRYKAGDVLEWSVEDDRWENLSHRIKKIRETIDAVTEKVKGES